MESAAARKFERRLSDLSVGQNNPPLDGFQVLRIQHDQRSCAFDFLFLTKSAGEPAVVETGVIRPVVLELPAEDGIVEQLGFLEVGSREFDVVDAPVVGRVYSCIVVETRTAGAPVYIAADAVRPFTRFF